jgi:hypothetical protein
LTDNTLASHATASWPSRAINRRDGVWSWCVEALAGSGRRVFTWLGELTGMPNDDTPFMLDSSDTFRAEMEIQEGEAEEMIVTQGGRQWTGGGNCITGAVC